MKNLTITLEERVLRWAKVWAARHDTSVSRLVGELLRERMQQEEAYGAAMRRFLGANAVALKREGAGYPARAEVHERHRLR